MTVLGLDTSNYTTSAALFDGASGRNEGGFLAVRPGELGLRQSEALFQHVKRMPEIVERLAEDLPAPLAAVGASTRPRPEEGSYMPCFLAGESQGRTLAQVLGVPFLPWSHQEGHLAAAAWSAGRPDLLDRPFLAWHLSGGTTELVLSRPRGTGLEIQLLGGTEDLAAGQLIDRTGALLGLPFPAGRDLDALCSRADGGRIYRVKRNGLTFSLSGMENQARKRRAEGESPERIARFVIGTVSDILARVTWEAKERFPGLPVLCSGGVSASRLLQDTLGRACGALFGQPRYASDNAMGIAVLTWRAMNTREHES